MILLITRYQVYSNTLVLQPKRKLARILFRDRWTSGIVICVLGNLLTSSDKYENNEC